MAQPGETEVPVKITIDPEDINRKIVEAIANSLVGEHVIKSIEQALAPYGRSVIQNAIDSEIQVQVRQLAREMIREPGELRDNIIAAINLKLTAERIDEIATNFVTELGKITARDV